MRDYTEECLVGSSPKSFQKNEGKRLAKFTKQKVANNQSKTFGRIKGKSSQVIILQKQRGKRKKRTE